MKMSFLSKPKQISSLGCCKREPPPEVVAFEGLVERRWKLEEPCFTSKQCFGLVDELEKPSLADEVNEIFWERRKTLKGNPQDQELTIALKIKVSKPKLKLTTSALKIELPKPKKNRVKKLARNNLRNGMTGKGGSVGAEGSIHNVNSSMPLTHGGARKCSSCGCVKCKCNLPSDLNNVVAYREGIAIDCPNKKRSKMDACMIHQYSSLVDELKKYPTAGRLFNLQTFDDQELNGILQSRWKSLKDYWHHNQQNLIVTSNSSDKVEFLKPRQDPIRKLTRKYMTSNRRSRSIGDLELPLSQGAYKCNSCGSIKCQCNKSNQESMGGKLASNAYNKSDFQRKCSTISEYDRDCASNNARLHSQLKIVATVTDETPGEALITSPNPTIPLLMSRKKANRVKKQHEKEKLLRRLSKEEAKVQDLIRAIEAAKKTIRDREREAARIALQKMGNTAGIELDLETQKELMILCEGSLSGLNLLHRLGLFLKHNYSRGTNLYEDHIRATKTIQDREREASRIALQKMENTGEIELNLETQKELMILCGGSLWGPNLLHRLGLFLKHEEMICMMILKKEKLCHN